MQRYKGAYSTANQQVRATMSPCGTFLFTSSADMRMHCWNVDTGDELTTASIELNYMRAARDIAFHPHEHLMAFCSHDTHAPILIFTYNPESI